VWEGWYRMKPRRSVLSEVDAPGYSVSDALSMRAYFTSSLCFIAEVAMLLPPYLMWGGSCAFSVVRSSRAQTLACVRCRVRAG
jgi:hypothetical protein